MLSLEERQDLLKSIEITIELAMTAELAWNKLRIIIISPCVVVTDKYKKK